MKIEIPFEIGDKVWFIHPKTMKAKESILKGIKIDVHTISTTVSQTDTTILKGFNIETKIKYNLDDYYRPSEQEFYVYGIFKTKEDLLKSL